MVVLTPANETVSEKPGSEINGAVHQIQWIAWSFPNGLEPRHAFVVENVGGSLWLHPGGFHQIQAAYLNHVEEFQDRR